MSDRYVISVRERYDTQYIVEADSAEEAEAMYPHDSGDPIGGLNFHDGDVLDVTRIGPKA